MSTLVKRDNLIPMIGDSNFMKQFESDEEIPIPNKYIFTEYEPIVTYKIIIPDDETFYNIIFKLRFYMVDDVPYEVYDYVRTHPHIDLHKIKDYKFDSLTLLKKNDKEMIRQCIDTERLDMNLLKYLFANKYYEKSAEWNVRMYSYVAKHGHLQILKLLHEYKCPIVSVYSTHNNPYLLCDYPIHTTIKYNQYECMVYLREVVGLSIGEREYKQIIKHSNIQFIKYIVKEKICPENIMGNIPLYLCSTATYEDYFKCVKYLYENGYSLSDDICVKAAGSGLLEYLKYVHERGGTMTDEVIVYSAYNENLECFYYALENGCNLTIRVLTSACELGILQNVKLLHDMKCPSLGNGAETYNSAESGSVECLKFLHENKYMINPDIHEWAISGRNINCIKYLVDNGIKLRIEDVRYVCTYRCKIYDCDENKKKTEQESYDIFRYIFSHCFCKVNCKRDTCKEILSRKTELSTLINKVQSDSSHNQQILKYVNEIFV